MTVPGGRGRGGGGAVRALLRTDLRAARRDTLVGPLLLVVPALVAAVRLAAPPLRALVAQRYGIDLADYYPWALSALFGVQIPFMVGGIVGLVVLDERDDGTLAALQVTPLGLDGYARYRVATAVVLALALAGGGAWVSGLADGFTLARAAVVGVPVALLVPVCALALLVPAANKVEGLAVMKALSFVLLAPLADWFVAAGWTPVLAVVPTYWVVHGVWAAARGAPAWPWALAGTLHTLMLLAWLVQRARRRLAGAA